MHQTTLWGGRAPLSKKRRRTSSSAGQPVSAATEARTASRATAPGGPPSAAASCGGSSFVQCPVCGVHVLVATSDEHVDQCLAKMSASATDEETKRPKEETKRGAEPSPAAASATTTKAQSLGLAGASVAGGDCPMATATSASASTPGNSSSITTEPASTLGGPAATAAATTTAGSALSAMMRSARERTERQTFFLRTTGTDASTWQLHWSWMRSSGDSGGKSSGSSCGMPSGPGLGPAAASAAPHWEGRFKSKTTPGKGNGTGSTEESRRELTITLAAWSTSGQAAAGGIRRGVDCDGVAFVSALAAAMSTPRSSGRSGSGAGAIYRGPQTQTLSLSPSQLKSALQKNVRLSRPAAAVRCAAAMVLNIKTGDTAPSRSIDNAASTGSASAHPPVPTYVEGMTQLVRRLLIIIFEDSLLHPAVPLLVWLLLALAKGFVPGLPHLLAVLGITEDVARSPWRDPETDIDTRTDAHVNNEQQRQQVQEELQEEAGDPVIRNLCWSLVESIRIRKLFGGMGGDLSMLSSYEILWRNRFGCSSAAAVRGQEEEVEVEINASVEDGPPGVADGAEAWLQFVASAYCNNTSRSKAAATMPAHNHGPAGQQEQQADADEGGGHAGRIWHAYGTAATAHTAVEAGGSGPTGTQTPDGETAGVTGGVGETVAELGRRCAATIRSASMALALGGQQHQQQPSSAHVGEEEPTLCGLATWLALRREDVPPSAIDFHCSNVLDALLPTQSHGRPGPSGGGGKQLGLRAAVLAAQKASLSPLEWADADCHEKIVAGAKAAMWICSSSINRKDIVQTRGRRTQRLGGGSVWARGGRYYYDGDPVPPVEHARVWAVMEAAAIAFQRRVINSRVPALPGEERGEAREANEQEPA